MTRGTWARCANCGHATWYCARRGCNPKPQEDWYVWQMDRGVISKHRTKAEAMRSQGFRRCKRSYHGTYEGHHDGQQDGVQYRRVFVIGTKAGLEANGVEDFQIEDE